MVFVWFPEEIVSSSYVIAITAGESHSLFLKSDGKILGMGDHPDGEFGDGTASPGNHGSQKDIATGSIGHNQISSQLLIGGNVSLSFVGLAGRITHWIVLSLVTCQLGATGNQPKLLPTELSFLANTPLLGTNNFWRIRSIQ